MPGAARLPRTLREERHVYQLRLPGRLWERFVAKCREEDRTASAILTRLVIWYVDEAEAGRVELPRVPR